MTVFSKTSAERIERAVLGWERASGAQAEPARTYANQQQWRWMKLKENLLPSADADASPCQMSAGTYTVVTGTTIKVYEKTGQQAASKSTWVLCRPMGTGSAVIWEVIHVPPRQRVVISAALTLGGSCQALLCDEDWDTGEDSTAITVYDTLEHYSLPAVLEGEDPVRGWVAFCGDSAKFELIDLQQPAEEITFTLAADSWDDVTVGAYYRGVSPARFWSQVDLTAPSYFTPKSGRRGWATWNDVSQVYVVYQLEC